MAQRRQPDRSRGVFETLLVVDGEPVGLEAHLQRLTRSLEEVYSRPLPTQAEEELRRAAAHIDLGRLRLTLAPAEDGLRIDLLARGVDPETVFPSRGVKLRAHPVAGGLGSHKWLHRSGIDCPAPAEAGALIVDDGEILEAGWANVFAVRGGILCTPPLDGRLLPGTTRAALLQLASEEEIEARELPLGNDDLITAEEVFLSGSIRGIEPALELDNQPLAGCGELSRRLAAALREHWKLPAPQAAATEPKLGQPSR
ncbi:MAG TPA: aminotransferase class IV [Solirubrobacterales bacterium]|nr:aminotransferase class IV [Solirubrobacterales bacterium]